jgi:drug/metabolite transporter (DMT)-like permease
LAVPLLPSRIVAQPSRLSLAAAYLAICVIWGSTYLAIKVGLVTFEPYFYAGLRYVLATALMLPIVRWQGATFAGPLRRWLPAVVVGVMFVGVSNGLVFWAETRLDSGFTALVITTSPLWTAVLSTLFESERRLHGGGWAGVAIGFAGAALLLAPSTSYRTDLLAVAAVAASVVVWVLTSLFVRRIRQDYHPLALTTVQMAAGSVVLLAVAVTRGTYLVGPVVPEAVAALVFLVVFGSCVAFSCYFYLLRHWEASRVSTSTYINPIVAVVLGWSLLGEVITGRMLLATAVILAGVTIVLRARR